MRIRPLGPADSRAVRCIEREAGVAFAQIGMTAVAGMPVVSMDELAELCAAGRSHVAADELDRPLAFLLSSIVDGCAHIEEVSVDPAAARRGIGGALIEHLVRIAGAEGLAFVTLTTFLEVPWNAPYYRRLGFVAVEPSAHGSQLAALVARERRTIPGDEPRVAMRRGTGR